MPQGDISDFLKNPYGDVEVSLLISSIDFSNFSALFDSFISFCPKNAKIEFLIKIDNGNDPKNYYDLVFSKGYRCKVLIYPAHNKKFSNHIFFNDLAAISSGFWLTILGEDARMVRGDWYILLLQKRKENKYKDNILHTCVAMDNGRGVGQICGMQIVTRAWYKVRNEIVPNPATDRWLQYLAKGIGRYSYLPEKKVLMYYPKGRRLFSKANRKKIFYPMLDKYIKIFNHHINSVNREGDKT